MDLRETAEALRNLARVLDGIYPDVKEAQRLAAVAGLALYFKLAQDTGETGPADSGWTGNKPAAPGYYWWRPSMDDESDIVEFDGDNVLIHTEGMWEKAHGFWLPNNRIKNPPV